MIGDRHPFRTEKSSMHVFTDRREAGVRLAERLRGYSGAPRLLVLGLPRGGVPVALEVALALHAPLDVFVVRKLGVPGQPEVAMGAIASGGAFVLNKAIVENGGISDVQVAAAASRERAELLRREQTYRGDRPPLELKGRTVLLVDDGLATGATMRAAVLAARSGKPARVVAAAPVGAPESCALLGDEADDVVCLHTPPHFQAVGQWYRRFEQTSDQEVRECLEKARAHDLSEGMEPLE